MEPSDESTLAYLREENIRLQGELDGLRQTYKQAADDRDLFHKQARALDLQVSVLRTELEEYKQALKDIVELNSGNNSSAGGLARIAERALSWQEDLKRHTTKGINVVGPRQREISAEEFAKGIGAEPMTPEQVAEWRRKHG